MLLWLFVHRAYRTILAEWNEDKAITDMRETQTDEYNGTLLTHTHILSQPNPYTLSIVCL